MTNSPDAAREYHRLTSYTTGFQTPDDPRKNIEWAGPMKEPRPPQFKTYEGGERLLLPRDLAELRISAVDALSGRALSGAPLDAAAIARILFYSAGLARRMEHDGRTVWFRHSGSAGNLFPLELYLVTRALDGLAAGVYQYDVLEHALVTLRSADYRGSVARALADDAAASAYIIITGIPWRTTWKYQDRGFRHIYWDAGTMLGQLLTLAAAQAVTTPQVRLGFVDEELRELVGADGIDEFPIAVVALGRSERAPESPALGDVPRGLLSPDLKRFPITSLAQESGALADAEQVRAWRAAAHRADAFAAPIPSEGSPPSSEVSLERTIRIRGSTRRFARGTAPAAPVSYYTSPSPRDRQKSRMPSSG
jgi:SagB-type dehydrogenase family enzyme